MASEKMYPLDWPKIFEQKNSKKAFEEQVLRAGLSVAQIKSEGSAYAEDAGGEFWTQRYVNATIGLMFARWHSLYGNYPFSFWRCIAGFSSPAS